MARPKIGDDTYSFSELIPYNNLVTDLYGTDTFSYAGNYQSCNINLNENSFSYMGSNNVVYITPETIIENAVGGFGNDALRGNKSNNVLIGGDGNDWLWGDEGNDTLYGGDGNDDLEGYMGQDRLHGGRGDDDYDIFSTDGNINGKPQDIIYEKINEGNDDVLAWVDYTLPNYVENIYLIGGSAAISATGNRDNNVMVGNENDNIINGREGSDILTGGAGADNFIFDTRLTLGTKTYIDIITDFTSGTDILTLNSKVFFAYYRMDKTNPIDLSQDFVKDTQPQDTTDHFIYNSSSGALYYDPDGSGTKAAVQLATLGTQSHPSLVATDIHII